MTPIDSFRAKLAAYVERHPSQRQASDALGVTRPSLSPLLGGKSIPSRKVIHRVHHEIGLTQAEVDELLRMNSERQSRAGHGSGRVRRKMHPHDAALRNWGVRHV